MKTVPAPLFTEFLAPPEASTHPVVQTAWAISKGVAAKYADDVDKSARFPSEAVDALREAGLLSLLTPTEFGGGGYDLSVASGVARALAVNCTATALVFAMHTIEVEGLRLFGTTSAFQDFQRELVQQQLLIANAASEVGLGSDSGRSNCALEQRDGSWSLEKQALAISYGRYADAIAVSARATPDSPPNEQVVVMVRAADAELTELSTWDTMGLRGTCSNSFLLRASGRNEMIFDKSLAEISEQSGAQATQIMISSVWVGLAEAAVSYVHRYARSKARKAIGTTTPAASRLAELVVKLQSARSLLLGVVGTYNELIGSEQAREPGWIVEARNLKVATSTLAAEITSAALAVCGISAFRREGQPSLDRLIRDAQGGLIMVSNDSNLQRNAQVLVALKSI